MRLVSEAFRDDPPIGKDNIIEVGESLGGVEAAVVEAEFVYSTIGHGPVVCSNANSVACCEPNAAWTI